MSCAHEVLTLLDELSRTDLQPSPAVDRAFQELVHLASTRPAVLEELSPDDLQRCRLLCARGEFEMENFWSAKIRATPNSLETFPYTQNYADLTDYEVEHVRKNTPQVRSWAFVGSGPLPLSAYFLARIAGADFPGLRISCIDSNQQAHDAGRGVLDALLPETSFEHLCSDARDVDYSGFDVVTLAALVGETSDSKMALIEKISNQMPSHATLAVRSVPADGRQLLYPRVEQLPGVVHCHGEPAPPVGVINSVMIVHRNHAGITSKTPVAAS